MSGRPRERSGNWHGGRIIKRGYVLLLIPGHPRSNTCGYVPEHVLVAERAIGKRLSRAHPIHHVDEDRTSNANSNLVICQSNSYHMLLHARMRILAAGGHPSKDKICGTCKRLLSRDLFYRNRSCYDGLGAHCGKCDRATQSLRWSQNRNVMNSRHTAARRLRAGRR